MHKKRTAWSKLKLKIKTTFSFIHLPILPFRKLPFTKNEKILNTLNVVHIYIGILIYKCTEKKESKPYYYNCCIPSSA